MLTINTGAFKRKKLHLPPTSHTRPTLNRARHAIFDMLSSLGVDWPKTTVCDAFAGSGAFGLEALSNGAQRCVFAEKNPKTFEILMKNICLFPPHIQQACRVYKDYKQIISQKIDLLFLDPPYNQGLEAACLGYMINQRMLHKQSLVILEQEQTVNMDNTLNTYIDDIIKQKTYGKSQITIFSVQTKLE